MSNFLNIGGAGGCLRVFDDAIVTLKTKIETLEVNANKTENHMINVNHTLKYDTISEKYYTPDDYIKILTNPQDQTVLEKGITHKKIYRNETNHYTDNLTD